MGAEKAVQDLKELGWLNIERSVKGLDLVNGEVSYTRSQFKGTLDVRRCLLTVNWFQMINERV